MYGSQYLKIYYDTVLLLFVFLKKILDIIHDTEQMLRTILTS